jgi:hypothetical protein
MVMPMKLTQQTNMLEKVKDCIVDGCLLYDGLAGTLALGIALSIFLTYGGIVLT